MRSEVRTKQMKHYKGCYYYKIIIWTLLYIGICKDQIWVPSPNDGWTKAQKAQNNKFVASGLEKQG